MAQVRENLGKRADTCCRASVASVLFLRGLFNFSYYSDVSPSINQRFYLRCLFVFPGTARALPLPSQLVTATASVLSSPRAALPAGAQGR